VPLAALLLPEFDAEMATARRMLERVPDGKSDWRPHAKSMTLGRLATHVSEIPKWVTNTITLDELDIAPTGRPTVPYPVLPTTAAILEQFERNAAEARALLVATSDGEFAKPWTFKFAGKTFWTKPKFDVYRINAMNHLVHHRAQLGVFLRLLDIAIPGSYGPSADERP
jgi:uncharacterized damage-inducible protein DinB